MDQSAPEGAEAFVFVLPGTAFDHAGFNYNYRFTRQFSSAATGEFGATLLPDDPPEGAVSPFAYGIWTGDPARYAMEREAELTRRAAAADKISRLDGVFFFADRETCEQVNVRWGWDLATVRHGRAYGHVDRYDMNISSALIPPTAVTDPGTRQRLWRSYFSGNPSHGDPDLPNGPRDSPPIWEYLVRGVIRFDADDISPFSP